MYIYYAYEEKASNLFHPAGFYSIYTATVSTTLSTSDWEYLILSSKIYRHGHIIESNSTRGRVSSGWTEKKY